MKNTIESHEGARLKADGGTRGEIPLERLEEVLEQIDQIGDDVQAQIQERLNLKGCLHEKQF